MVKLQLFKRGCWRGEGVQKFSLKIVVSFRSKADFTRLTISLDVKIHIRPKYCRIESQK